MTAPGVTIRKRVERAIVALQTCASCQCPQSVIEFHVRRANPNGRASVCKQCVAIRETYRKRELTEGLRARESA